MQHLLRGVAALLVLGSFCVPVIVHQSVAASGGKAVATPQLLVKRQLPSLRLAMPDAPTTVDPALVADEENAELSSLLYIGLVRLDAHYRVVPSAAARITIAPDHRTYTFYLRHDLRFSNGDPIHAQDFAFALKRSLTPSVKSPSAPTYLLDIQGAQAVLAGKASSVTGIKVINDYTLRLTARWPVPYFLMELTYPTSYALDEKAIRKLGPIDNTAWYTNPVSSGPFRLKTWIPNQKIVLVPNKYFAGPKPQLKQVVISLVPLPLNNLYQYVTKSLDIVNLPSDERSLVHEPGVHQTTMLAIDGIYMNLKWKPFGSRAVRRALNMALDRNKLVAENMDGAVTPFGGYVPPGEAGYDPSLRLLSHSPTLARAELKAGLQGKPFPPTTLYYLDDPTLAQLASAIVKAWHQTLGINVSTAALTSNTLLAKQQSGSLPLYLSGWSADYPDPHDWLSAQWKSQVLNNDVNYSNKSFDTLVEAADVTWNPAKRQLLYDQAQQLLVNDAAWIPLYIPYRLVYIRPAVQNVFLTGYGVIPANGAWAEVRVAAESPPSASHRQ